MGPDRRSVSRSRLTLGLLVLTSLTLVTLDARGFGPIESARSSVLGVLAPVGDAAGSVLEPVGDAWDGAWSQGELREENEALRQRVMELQGELADAEYAQRELEQLQEALDLTAGDEVPTVMARVVAGAAANFEHTVQLDRGSASGIEVGMPVVAGGGLVGRVVEVATERAVVELIPDPSFRVGVRVPGTTGVGVARGRGDEARLTATFDIRTELDEGDVLVTSGGERSFYPPDVPVGRITDIRADDVALEQEVGVELLANIGDLLYATVLLSEPVE